MTQGGVDQDTIVGDDIDTEKLVSKHEQEAHERSLPIWRRPKELEASICQAGIKFVLLLDEIELLSRPQILRISFRSMQAADDFEGLLASVLR